MVKENNREITNEQKAKELVQTWCNYDKYFARDAYNAVMDMAEWKDKQYAKVLIKLIVELDELKHQVKSLLP